MSLSWLYLDLNSYFASVEQHLHPELRNRPIAVVPAMTDATCAIAASYEAKAYGIKTGTLIYEAKKLCPGLVCVRANHEHYVAYHHKILEEIERHIHIDIVASIDEVACKLMNNEREEDDAIEIALRIKAGIRRNIGESIRCSIGIAPNRFLAKTASNLEKPDGLQVLYAEDVPAKIAHWELDKLTGIGRGMRQRFHHAGIVSMPQLYALSPKHMRRIWGGVQGERFWHLLRGTELPDIATSRRTVGHSHVLEPEWRPSAKAKQVMRRLLLKAASRLRRMQYHATHLSISIRIEHGPRIAAQRSFHHACDNMTLLHEALVLWHDILKQHPATRIKKVSVTLHGLVKDADIQPSLFAEPVPYQKYESLSRAMDRINERFGRDSITMGGLPHQVRAFSGTKVAFTRIPDMKEFHE